MIEKRKNNENVPNLRFPGFEGEWEKYTIQEILKIGSGKDYKHLEKGNIPVFGTGGYMTSVNKYLYDGETVCIGRKGTINNPFFFNGKLWTVDTLFYTHSFNKVLPKFVFYLAENINWLKYNEASGVPSLSKRTIEKIKIKCPSINEQKKINSLLTSIDERIQTQNEIINGYESLMKGLKERIFTQKLRFKKKSGSLFPKWENKKLEEFLSIPVKRSPDKINPSKILTVKLHLNGVFLNERVDGLKLGATKYIIRQKGQFIYGKQNLFNGAFGIIPDEFDGFLSSGDVPSLDIDSELINPMYLYHFLARESYYKRFEAVASGSGSKRVHEKTLLSHKLLIPSLEEQDKIASFLSEIDSKIQVEKDILKFLQNQKKHLLQQMFI